jgi:hypothetical protein
VSESCKTCRFWHAHREPELKGECRRRAAVIETRFSGPWPRVDDGDWCGEYEAHPDAQRTGEMVCLRAPEMRGLVWHVKVGETDYSYTTRCGAGLVKIACRRSYQPHPGDGAERCAACFSRSTEPAVEGAVGDAGEG